MLGRPPIKSREVVAALRQTITSGVWPPGTRVPPRRELCKIQGCSPSTLQYAMDTLAAEGFIISMGQNGTLVCDSPPHLTDIAVVFPEFPRNNRFLSALNNEIQLPREDGLSLTGWYGITGHIDDPGYHALIERIESRQLAGIIIASNPRVETNTPLLTHSSVPQVAFASPNQSFTNLGTIVFSQKSFMIRAAEHMRNAGKSRVAVITHPRADLADWEAAFAQSGLSLPPHRFHPVDLYAVNGARHLARLLFHEDQTARPDAIIISDDNLVEAVTLGMAEAGVHAFGEVEIIAHCNFPWPPSSSLPVTRLGWDARAMLNLALDTLGDMRQGKAATIINVDAIFETEIGKSAGRS